MIKHFSDGAIARDKDTIIALDRLRIPAVKLHQICGARGKYGTRFPSMCAIFRYGGAT